MNTISDLGNTKYFFDTTNSSKDHYVSKNMQGFQDILIILEITRTEKVLLLNLWIKTAILLIEIGCFTVTYDT